MNNKAKIKEIFSSIQGEGLLVGVEQIFIRFCKCNLACKYCDTDFSSDYKEYSPQELTDYLRNNFDFNKINSISLTGGEPLLWIDFLAEFLPLVDLPIYLETNGTVVDNVEKILDKIDYVSADIKLPSCSGLKESFKLHDKFFDKFYNSKAIVFAKIVFDEKITDEEIKLATDLSKKYGFEIILQPKMIGDKMSINSAFIRKIFYKFLEYTKNVRVIPQVHKFLGVE